MASTTALEMVNRLLRRTRGTQVQNFASEQSLAALEYVNAAKEDVLTSLDWYHDIREDGVIHTLAPLSSTTASLSLNSILGNDTALAGRLGTGVTSFLGNHVTRMEYQGDSVSAGDANLVGSLHKILYATEVGGTGYFGLDSRWRGASVSLSAKVRYFVSEYLLPDTVREVVSLTTQSGTPLKLEPIGAHATFDEAIPDKAALFGEPRWAGVGGYDLNTYNSVSNPVAEEPQLRVVLYPAPDDYYRLSYSYYYQHPPFAAIDDELVGVPPEIVSRIIEKASADWIAFAEQRVNEGITLGREVERRIARRHATANPQPARRYVVRSWESGRAGRSSVRNGFPGVTIEE